MDTPRLSIFAVMSDAASSCGAPAVPHLPQVTCDLFALKKNTHVTWAVVGEAANGAPARGLGYEISFAVLRAGGFRR